MVTNNTYYYAIKYKVKKIDDNKFFLIPTNLEGGIPDGVDFSTDHGNYPLLRNKNSFTHKYVISSVFHSNDLEKIYDYYDDTNTLGKYFFEDNREKLLYVEVEPSGELVISKFDVGKYRKSKIQDSMATYYYEDEEACVKLNETICNKLLSCNNIEEMKKIIELYKTTISQFVDCDNLSISKIDTVNNKIVAIGSKKQALEEGDYEEAAKNEVSVNINKNVICEVDSDISNKGLYNAIRERVFGHDKEIKIISRRLYRNYKATDDRKIKSILITGPTGTGKTETIKAAADYLGLPFAYANTSDLVPTGIVGPKIEDYILDLYYQAGKDLTKAEKGLFFLDEYDKIGNLEVKSAVKPSLLSFNGGEKILLPQVKKGFSFDTSRLNRVYAGVFERLNDKERKMGFVSSDEKEKDNIFVGPEIKRAIVEKGYFTKEDLGRISTFIKYDQLDIETKKDILLHCKTSALLDTIKGYKDDFGIDVEVTDEFLDALLESIPIDEGIRDISGYLDEILDEVEEELCDNPKNTYKKLVLKKDIVDDHSNFKLY